jgi:hypothetical protein
MNKITLFHVNQQSLIIINSQTSNLYLINLGNIIVKINKLSIFIHIINQNCQKSNILI